MSRDFDTPPETPLAKAAIPRLSLARAEVAVQVNQLYLETARLLADPRVANDTDAAAYLLDAQRALDRACEALRVVR